MVFKINNVNMLSKKFFYSWLILLFLLANSTSASAKTIDTASLQIFPRMDRVSSAPNPNYVKLLVVIVNPLKADSLSITNEEVEDIIFGEKQSLKTFYKENSYNSLNVVGNVVGPFDISEQSFDVLHLGIVDPFIDARGYDRLLIISTISGPCDGFASLAPSDFMTDEGLVHLAVAVTSGQCVPDFRDPTKNNGILHEFGHTLGLKHVSAWLPGPAVGCSENIPLNNIDGNNNCISNYGGGTVMGSGSTDLNNFQRSKVVSAFNPSFVFPSLTITENGDHWVRWFKDSPDTNSYDELKISGVNGYFSVEFRKNTPPMIDQEKIFINFIPDTPFGLTDTLLVRAPAFALQNVDDVYQDNLRNFSVRVLQMEENRALLRITVN